MGFSTRSLEDKAAQGNGAGTRRGAKNRKAVHSLKSAGQSGERGWKLNKLRAVLDMRWGMGSVRVQN